MTSRKHFPPIQAWAKPSVSLPYFILARRALEPAPIPTRAVYEAAMAPHVPHLPMTATTYPVSPTWSLGRLRRRRWNWATSRQLSMHWSLVECTLLQASGSRVTHQAHPSLLTTLPRTYKLSVIFQTKPNLPQFSVISGKSRPTTIQKTFLKPKLWRPLPRAGLNWSLLL